MFLSLLILMILPGANAADWREFRGPDGVGHYQGPPVVTEWGVDRNVIWKVPVPGKGWSSPIIIKDTLILTTAEANEDGSQKLSAIAFDTTTGKERWKKLLFEPDAKLAGQMHKKNSHASPTPVSDGERVWIHFGHMGTACLGLDGTVIWKTLKYTYAPMHGCGGSPILDGNKLIFSVDGLKTDQYVVALDKATGNELWKTGRETQALMKFTFTTPQIIEAGGKRMLISAASDFACAYDPADGKELWRVKYPVAGWSLITRPVMAGGLVIIQTGYSTQHLMAIDPTATGDDRVKWKDRKDAPNTPTPIVAGDDLYSISDAGMMVCYDPKTGTRHWSERLRGKAYSASPILANGLIYVTSEEGVGQVIKPSKSGLDQVSQSEMKEKTFATFVPSQGSLFVRTETQLYRFGKR